MVKGVPAAGVPAGMPVAEAGLDRGVAGAGGAVWRTGDMRLVAVAAVATSRVSGMGESVVVTDVVLVTAIMVEVEVEVEVAEAATGEGTTTDMTFESEDGTG
jgi:hypothetical protein